ncbi:MAG: sel1 repeat family protein [Notoacmeibacter sp.]|nr:sel1 repeat family protein [Notoacmeibacter sp.]MCC0032341.1 sel1 repeat family protein [Brucellaceae bacterium]
MPTKSRFLAAAGLLTLALLTASPAFADPCDDLAASPWDETRPAGVAGVEPEEIDVDKALPACTAAFEGAKDDPRIAFQYARVLELAGEEDKAKALYEQAAKAGHAGAIVNHGFYLEETDPQAALKAYEEAAAAGNAVGLYNAGTAWKDGLGTTPDAVKAIDYLTRAGEKGYMLAFYNLAVIQDEGQLVPRDMEKAVPLYRKAIDAGIVDAMFNLAMVLEKGDGVPADKDEAIRLFQMAADAGDDEARENVERLKAGK